MNPTLIQDAFIVNEGKIIKGSLLISDNKIAEIFINNALPANLHDLKVINAKDKYLLPGVIDTHVHFRDPGLTEKGDFHTESKAAIAGGVTTVMDMPNTSPSTTSFTELELKNKLASGKSLTNYSLYIGATNNNIDEIINIPSNDYCGIKLFLGQSTGNLLINDTSSLMKLFTKSKKLVAAHCEDSDIINKNLANYKSIYGINIPVTVHNLIRSTESCYKSTSYIVNLAKKYNKRLHVLHLSTKEELDLFDNSVPLADKLITSEVCIHHLYFDNSHYNTLGNKIKTNPSIKTGEDKVALFEGLLTNKIDTIATDHAPHTPEEKQLSYLNSPSGCPGIQHSLPAMLEFYHHNKISIEKIVEKMCHAPADIFSVDKRGYIRKGYWADLTIVDLNSSWEVTKNNILYKCNWSPFEGKEFRSKITHTFVNGNLLFENGVFHESNKGQKLEFNQQYQ
jgi:dihydroorotase